MRQNPYLSCLNATVDLLISVVACFSAEKRICAHVLARPYPSDPYNTIFVFPLKYTRVFVTGSYASLSFLILSSLHLSYSLQSSLWLHQCMLARKALGRLYN
ncbi:unnamed protein product [Hymenolepis diminuta]|uniref:Uncharacterized protein n=1 Tax=Hymenolepis diminuta TaxID=6216 RepID=A0A564Y6A6_HYMDI|nr:unnamed protein product [Hymenolepis diminuta]